MKRSVTLILAVVFSLAALSAFAGTAATKAHKPMGTELKGTITSIDDPAKSFVLNSAGKDNTITWTSATKVHGGPLKATENVVVSGHGEGRQVGRDVDQGRAGEGGRSDEEVTSAAAGEPEDEDGSSAVALLDADFASVIPRRLRHDRQTEPRSLGARFARMRQTHERLEDPFPILRRDARTAIRDAD